MNPATGARPHPNPALLYTLIGWMQLFWTANFLIGKIALREFPGALAASLRVEAAALLILPVYWWRSAGRVAWERRDLPMLLLLGLVGVGVNQFFFVIGLGRTSVSHSSLIIGMTPISVLLLGAWQGVERLTRRKLAGMLLALAGVAALNLEPRAAGQGPTLSGDLFTLLAGTAFALYTVLGTGMVRKYGTLAVNTVVYLAGAALLAPVAVWEGAAFSFAPVSNQAWAALLYMAVFPSLVCYLIYYYALHYIAPSRLSMLAYLQPLAATAAGVLWFGERVSTPLLAGGGLILAGVYLAERRA